MARAPILKFKHSQAVLLPKDVAFPEGVTEVEVFLAGTSRVIVPAGAMWDDFFAAPGIDLPVREDQLLCEDWLEQ